MKKLFSILLAAVLCMGLMPFSAFAATTLSHVDITLELPKDGDVFEVHYIPTVTSFTGDGIDLLANGAGIMDSFWDSQTNLRTFFHSGVTYNVTLQLMFGPGYCTNGTTASTGETVVTPEIFSATVNGQDATVRWNASTYYPTIEINLKLEGELLNAQQKAARNEEWEQIKKARRKMNTPRTRAEAETYNRDNMPEKVVVVTDSEGKDLYENRENMTTVVFDVNNAEKMAADIAGLDYLKEIWLSPETDPYEFIKAVKDAQRNVSGGYYYYEVSAAIPMYLADAAVFIPESRVSEFRQAVDDKEFNGYPGGAFTVKCYSGDDVVAAQKAGASAAKEICTTHKYTEQIRSADRIYHFADHNDYNLYYYSCGYCGKCEYNPNHVNYRPDLEALNIDLDSYKALQRHGTVYAELPADKVYIGVNTAGEHVWWNSCELCGVFDRYSVNEYDWRATGTAIGTFAEYKSSIVEAGNKTLEKQALSSAERYYPGTFSLPLKSDAKMSEWAQSDVNLALNDNIIDTAMLGSDYTQNISRLQFCSVAVKLAEELTEKSITPANVGTFTDTSNAYALKAYAAGITSGVTATEFDPNGTLTRQQMATFLYRALRYAEKNSDYSYTDYTSKLSKYTDSWSIQSWAAEAMAFMNALDLVKGSSDTALNPDGICTVEQAVAVAGRSVYAHLLGWYQVNKAQNMSSTSELGKAKMGGFALREGDYVWVTGRRYGAKLSSLDERSDIDSLYVPVVNPFNGQAAEMKNGDLVPVRN